MSENGPGNRDKPASPGSFRCGRGWRVYNILPGMKTFPDIEDSPPPRGRVHPDDLSGWLGPVKRFGRLDRAAKFLKCRPEKSPRRKMLF